MTIENVTYSRNQDFSIKGLKSDKGGWGFSLQISDDDSNCKLSYIHRTGNMVNISDEDKKIAIDAILKKCKGCVIINTTQKKVFDFFEKTYPVYYKAEVPIGYNNGFQYHICIKNTISVNKNCRDPEPIGNVKIDKTNKVVIKNKLTEVLKRNRRKTDIVDELIREIS